MRLIVQKMTTIPYTTVRQNFKSTMQQICGDQSTVIVTRTGGDSVVMMSLDEYNAMMETFHLLKSPKNAERLLSAIENVSKNHVLAHELIEA